MTNPIGQRPTEILLVEDNEGDIVLTIELLESGPHPVRVQVARDGEEAMQYLNREGAHENSTRPDLVLLDLNLPRMHGIEVLERLKQNDELASIPVVIFSSSDAEADVNSCYHRHANCYIAKPSDLDAYDDALNQLMAFWLETARLPIH